VVVSEALAAGHSIVSIDRTPCTMDDSDTLVHRTADITDYEALLANMDGCDALIHLAAIPAAGIVADDKTHNNNVTGSYNALRAAAELRIRRVCQASSINAIGINYSREPVFDYFPIDEKHATRAEDPYSLSKWLCEQQANSFVRRYDMFIASMRLHYVTDDKAKAVEEFRQFENPAKHLWGWTPAAPAARAALASLELETRGHEIFHLIGSESVADTPTTELAARYFPAVSIRENLDGHASFFSSTKAARMLGWPS